MKVQEDLMTRNMERAVNSRNTLVTTILKLENKFAKGDRWRKINELARKEEVKAYEAKWANHLDVKMKFLMEKYKEEDPVSKEESAMLEGIKWRDVELGEEEAKDYYSNVVVLGEINPPLSEEELAILSEDPAYCIEARVTDEELSISLEEGKVKRLWSEMSKVQVEEGETNPTEAELKTDN